MPIKRKVFLGLKRKNPLKPVESVSSVFYDQSRNMLSSYDFLKKVSSWVYSFLYIAQALFITHSPVISNTISLIKWYNSRFAHFAAYFP